MDGENTESPKSQSAVTIDSIRNECLDSAGYVVFVGVISNQRDAAQNNIINFRYIREKYSYEDTKRAIEKFKEALARDIDE